MTRAALAPPCLIVTRPEPEATRWVQALQAQGQPAQALPLIRIAPQAIAAAQRPQPGQHLAWMFVSGAAVRGFFSQLQWQRVAGPSTRFWCTGPGTAAALQAAGVPPERIDSPALASQQFDSEGLWDRVQSQVQAGARVCIVRGGDAEGQAAGRPWLARTLTAAGVQVDTVVAYRRLPPVVEPAWTAQVRNAVTPAHTWLFSSSEAVHNLRLGTVALPALPWSQTRALATHARIAQALGALGMGHIQIVAPVLEAVRDALRARPLS